MAAAAASRAMAAHSNPELLGDLGAFESEREIAWLQPFQRTWETIEEDEHGQLKSTNRVLALHRKSALLSESPIIVEKGIIRFVCVLVDFSQSMTVTDLKPSRRLLTLSLLTQWTSDFFDSNPLSQLSFILCHRGIAIKITELSGHPQEQIRKLREKCEGFLLAEERVSRIADKGSKGKNDDGNNAITGGEFSLQNGLEMARSSLQHAPPYGAREMIVIVSALSSIDAGDVTATIAACKEARIQCCVIHLAAELYLFHHLATVTGGSHSVILNKQHYETVLRSLIPPSPLTASMMAERASHRRWMRMAFPALSVLPYPLYCECHTLLTYEGFTCPQCRSRYCELPTQCKVCSLQLVSAPQLARTYHHLFPTKAYTLIDTDTESNNDSGSGCMCSGCQRIIDTSDDIVVRCPACHCDYCIDCDEFVHNVLHQCPTCHSQRKTKDETKDEQDVGGSGRGSGGGGAVSVKRESASTVNGESSTSMDTG